MKLVESLIGREVTVSQNVMFDVLLYILEHDTWLAKFLTRYGSIQNKVNLGEEGRDSV